MKIFRGAGFTLIEIMITVAIVAILAAIAYPAYRDQVRKTRRADATAALLDLAQFMERNYTESNGYDKDSAGNAIALPYAEAPKEGTTKYYDLSLPVLAPTAYTLQAVPKGVQTGDPCGTFTLTNTGLRDVTGSAGKDQCWHQ